MRKVLHRDSSESVLDSLGDGYRLRPPDDAVDAARRAPGQAARPVRRTAPRVLAAPEERLALALDLGGSLCCLPVLRP
ncbi:hypothetical protein AB0G83_34690 [Streptomyces klenkii]|uniref:hypothetical protein n=1 Tax=Streptomyces klenkii TaxID=1420899 RepID=UPI0033EA61B1